MPKSTKPPTFKATEAGKKLFSEFTGPRPSVTDRMAAGKRLRTTVPRASLAEYKPQKTRKDPVAILETQAKTRLQNLIPVRYARMLTSPFAFLRGTAAVMAQDLSPLPVTGLQVQVCGDMHVSNFGVFASAERSLVFGINDFDETIPGPWEWDLKRLATSAVVAGQFIGKDRNDCEAYQPRCRRFLPAANSRIRRNRLSRHMVFSHSRGRRIGLGSAKAAATMAKSNRQGQERNTPPGTGEDDRPDRQQATHR